MISRECQITGINMILHIHQTSGMLRQFKHRKDYGLVFVERGSIRFDHKSQTYLVDNNQVMLIAKDIDYAITFESTCSFYVINFNLICEESCLPFHSFNLPVAGTIVTFLRQLCIDWDFRHDSAQQSYISRVYQLLAMIKQSDTSRLDRSLINATIAPSVEYLRHHYTDPDISNDKLAQISNISTVYFRKLFAQQFGQSPMSYIRNQRIDHAKMLLRSEYYESITDVALCSGFKSLYHFSKTFRQVVGVSPTEYLAGDPPES